MLNVVLAHHCIGVKQSRYEDKQKVLSVEESKFNNTDKPAKVKVLLIGRN